MKMRIDFQLDNHGAYRASENIATPLNLPESSTAPAVGDYIIRDSHMYKVVGRRWYIGDGEDPAVVGFTLMLDEDDKKLDWRG